MGLKFEWDKRKAAANLKKHGVSFEETATAFGDPLSLTIPDPDHSIEEDRYLLVGVTSRRNLVVVAHTERNDTIRIVSARPATAGERKNYEEG
jgi:uncharacterized DUF497 family protein